MTILDQFKLTGKRCIVTGGSRGIGESFAHALAGAGPMWPWLPAMSNA